MGGKQKRKTKPLKHKETDEEKQITSIVLSMLQTEVQRADANAVRAISMADKTAAKVDSLETRVMVSIQNELKNFKEEVIRSVLQVHNNANATTHGPRANVSNTNHEQQEADTVIPQCDANEAEGRIS